MCIQRSFTSGQVVDVLSAITVTVSRQRRSLRGRCAPPARPDDVITDHHQPYVKTAATSCLLLPGTLAPACIVPDASPSSRATAVREEAAGRLGELGRARCRAEADAKTGSRTSGIVTMQEEPCRQAEASSMEVRPL
jgi:hypothetical protein